MRCLFACIGLFGIANAQAPDVRFHLDLYGSYDILGLKLQSVRLYDPLGNSSAVQMSVTIDRGIRAFFSERLQQFSSDASHDLLEQYYVEDQGIWRAGKQYLPFGTGNLVRENVLAARGETNLLMENTTLALAICDGGAGNQRGIVGRFGGLLGVSAAVGSHFGISPTSFDQVRRPEDAPGAGRGWSEMFGLDLSRRLGLYSLRGEVVWLEQPSLAADGAQSVLDMAVGRNFGRGRVLEVGYSHGSHQNLNVFRALARLPITKAAEFEPVVRMRNDRLWDVAFVVHMRL